MMRKMCRYEKGRAASLMLPPPVAQLPGIAFHLRRSAAIRTAGASPDRTAYFRHLACSLDVFSTLVLVQPTLVGRQLGRGDAVPLQASQEEAGPADEAAIPLESRSSGPAVGLRRGEARKELQLALAELAP